MHAPVASGLGWVSKGAAVRKRDVVVTQTPFRTPSSRRRLRTSPEVAPASHRRKMAIARPSHARPARSLVLWHARFPLLIVPPTVQNGKYDDAVSPTDIEDPVRESIRQHSPDFRKAMEAGKAKRVFGGPRDGGFHLGEEFVAEVFALPSYQTAASVMSTSASIRVMTRIGERGVGRVMIEAWLGCEP